VRILAPGNPKLDDALRRMMCQLKQSLAEPTGSYSSTNTPAREELSRQPTICNKTFLSAYDNIVIE